MTKELQPHQQRVFNESVELQDKIEKLQVVIDVSPIYQGLDPSDAILLSAQLAAMTAYNRILQARIQKF
ncbi:crAss001_48 related protein [Yokenella regensburgei]|uniref:crAss001_48 related protein n=1 Tax=Yokenella regensburgei TaxID=158877 RepID=UPI0031CF0A07